jgi:hypothetical protein
MEARRDWFARAARQVRPFAGAARFAARRGRYPHRVGANRRTKPIRRPRARRVSLLALALPVLLAAGAPPARATDARVCPAQSLGQVFLPWADPGWYAPLPDAGFEVLPGGWTLRGGAQVVAGNEPFHVGGSADTHSLSLPSGSSATSGTACVGLGDPTLRLFVRNTGAPDAGLLVQVQFDTGDGLSALTPVGVVHAGTAWAPSPPLPVVANLLAAQSARFTFTPADPRGRWAIDDAYVDPYGKG